MVKKHSILGFQKNPKKHPKRVKNTIFRVFFSKNHANTGFVLKCRWYALFYAFQQGFNRGTRFFLYGKIARWTGNGKKSHFSMCFLNIFFFYTGFEERKTRFWPLFGPPFFALFDPKIHMLKNPYILNPIPW